MTPDRRLESERAAAGEHDRVHLLHDVARPQQIGLVRAGRPAAHIDAGDARAIGEDDGAAGDGAPVDPVPDANAGHVGDRSGAV